MPPDRKEITIETPCFHNRIHVLILFRFDFDLDWDIKIWVEAPKEVCLERGLARENMLIPKAKDPDTSEK